MGKMPAGRGDKDGLRTRLTRALDMKWFVSQDARRVLRAVPPEALSRLRGALEAERTRLEALEARLGELIARPSP
jgi:hypothetical protein